MHIDLVKRSGRLTIEFERLPGGLGAVWCYETKPNGGAAFFDSFDQGPFDSLIDLERWLLKALIRSGFVLPM